MREIIFRGKRLDNGKWVYGYLLVTQMSGVYIIGTKTKSKQHKIGGEVASVSISDVVWQYEVDPETVGQYTGLKDKNGKEIYEGDILEEEPGYYFEVIWSVECAKFKLQWRTKAIQYPEWNRGVNMTVIGSRWDNPELLKEGSV